MKQHFLNLPDPDYQPELYADVTMKRFLAWFIDAVLISLLTLLVVLFTAFTAILVLGFVSLLISIAYRWVTLTQFSATPGMRVMSVELRTHRGERLDSQTALIHSSLFVLIKSMILPQIFSIGMMFTTRYGQSLQDSFCGVVGINRPSSARLARG